MSDDVSIDIALSVLPHETKTFGEVMNISFYIIWNIWNTLTLSYFITNTITETINKNRFIAYLWYFSTVIMASLFYIGVTS